MYQKKKQISKLWTSKYRFFIETNKTRDLFITGVLQVNL